MFQAIAIGAVFLTTALSSKASSPKSDRIQGPRIENVRTTAYSSGGEHNGPYGPKNALGTRLKTGELNSAAADWSRYPVGTRFRIVETGKEYVIDDYGSALVGTGTIDLYKPSNSQVNKWGVRRVTIEIIEWGSPEKSLKILEERGRMRHIRQMVQALRNQDSV